MSHKRGGRCRGGLVLDLLVYGGKESIKRDLILFLGEEAVVFTGSGGRILSRKLPFYVHDKKGKRREEPNGGKNTASPQKQD